VGELFRSRTNNRRHSDVLVFITPRIIDEDTPREPLPPDPKFSPIPGDDRRDAGRPEGRR
jgi:Flp pilus assembly secretin CpaC